MTRDVGPGPLTEAEPDLLARLWLSKVVEPGDERVAMLLAELGAESTLALLRRGPSPDADASTARWRAVYAERLARTTDDARPDPAAAVAATPSPSTVRFIGPGDDEWPVGLADLGLAAPLGLWLRGAERLDLLPDRLAIVGSRAATAYGEHMASTLASALGERGWVVVSGGAYGIDAAAHRGALAVDAPTIAVLACGVDVAYPAGHHALFDRIAQTGVLVSELAPREHPTRSRFLRRNQVIAALTSGTVVVEAALRSGATSTVNHALSLNRVTMGVPGPVTSPVSAGVHQLIRDMQSTLVTDADEVLELVSESGTGIVERRRGSERTHDRLDTIDQQILDSLRPRKPTSTDAVADRLALTTVDVLVRLGRLESRGLSALVDGGWVVRGWGRDTQHGDRGRPP